MDVLHGDGGVTEVSEKLEKSLSMDDKEERFHRLIQEGKDMAKRGDLIKALDLFRQARDIHQSEKLDRRIKKMEEILQEKEEEEEDEEFVNVNGSGLMLFKELHDKLYDYQREGVAFLYSLHRDGLKGGILADDMGLGKTIQVISFLSGMYDSEAVRHTLLVMPTSLITNWTKEFSKWTPGMRVKEFHGTSKVERTRNLEKVQRRSGVIITTYTMLMNNWQQLSSYQGREFTWDYMILDEAHKIKTPATKTAKSASNIPSKNRVLLTGTPVQNNLREMWALFDFACQGALLGTAKTFKTEYENPITRAREKDATPGERALGLRMSENLMAIIRPHFLRRTKAEVQKKKMSQSRPQNQDHRDVDPKQDPDPPRDSGAVVPTLTRKNDLIVWTYLSSVQEDIYRQFISLDHIKELLLTTRSPLAELTILKKLCDHPRLLSAAAISKLGLEDLVSENQQSEDTDLDTHNIANIPDDSLISESGKMVFLFDLLEQLRSEGHRTLVFAHYRKVLDILQRILGNRGFKVLRLDGTITQIAEREKRISLFQKDSRYSVFLLTTQVGGVGITLTAADRVVIYDPSWNPATDAQAVDRAYRIGQTENVVIYRLITCGTVEEKIYRRQVFKDSLIRQNTGDKKNPFRYFSKQELKELFTLEDPRSSSTQLQLQALHSRHRRTDPLLDQHIAHLHAMEMFGISDHDLMFSLDVNQEEQAEDQEEQQYIEGRVQKAQELMKAESELQMQITEGRASGTEPAWLRQPVDNQSRDKRQSRNPEPSPPSPPCHSPSSSSLLEVESVPAGSGGGVIDLTEDESPSEGQSLDQLILDSPKQLPAKQETSPQEDESISEVVLNGQSSNSSFRVDASSRLSAGLESFEGNFNLQLEDTDFEEEEKTEEEKTEEEKTEEEKKTDEEKTEEEKKTEEEETEEMEEETEEEQEKLLSQLKMDGSFDVNKSLSESRHHQGVLSRSLSLSLSVHQAEEESMDESPIVTKRKRGAVIYDDDDDDDDDEEQQNLDGDGLFENSFQIQGASTPVSSRRRKSVGANTSVASHRSLLHSIVEDMDDLEQDLADEEEEEEEEEEPSGETINSEGGEEEEDEVEEEEEDEVEEESDDVIGGSGEEEWSSAPELTSTEKMDPCTVDAGAGAQPGVGVKEPESYELLVSRGRECYSHGQLEAALSFFLKAIDIQQGDPEIQMLTIRLYQKITQIH